MMLRPRSALVKVALTVVLLAVPAVTRPPAAQAAPASPSFGPSIDPFAAYVGQTTCDPTAKPGAIGLRDLLEATYPATTPIGIGRDCATGGQSEHKEGRAYDWGVNALDPAQKAMADDFFGWLLATDQYGNLNAMARRLGLMYVIWNRQIWKSYGTNRGWQAYTGTSPHTDHAHFSLSWDGAYKRTSWWTAAGPTALVVPGGNGVASSPDATALLGSNRLDYVVKGTNNMVYLKTLTGSTWSGYTYLGGPTTAGIKGDPALASWGPGRLDVFVRGADDKLWQRASNDGGASWTPWAKPVGNDGTLTSGPDVAARGPNRLDVVVLGAGGAVLQRTWDGASWGPSWLQRGGFATGDPTVASWSPGRLDVFVRGGDGKLWHSADGGSGWTGWMQPPGTEAGVLADPGGSGSGVLDAASWGLGHYSVFARGGDNMVYEARYTGGSRWVAWTRPVHDVISGGPGAASRGAGRLDVIVRAQDSSAHHYLVS